MPLPLLIAGLGLLTASAGAGAHMEAKEFNSKAQIIARDAHVLYENSKKTLEYSQKNTELELINLGKSKKKILDTSISQFIEIFNRIKHTQLSKSVGLNELSHFTITEQGVVELRELSNIYQSAISSGTAGAATGAIISLAISGSGSLALVQSAFSSAQLALSIGEIGTAAGFASVGLSTAAAITPLSAIAAPVILFTGISSNIKAEENLEKAKTMYAEVEVACEKMKVSETLCKAISDRSIMFNNLLNSLNDIFYGCVQLLDKVTREKLSNTNYNSSVRDSLSKAEIELAAVTGSLAGAIKSVIDTPILSKNGRLSNESRDLYNTTSNLLPKYIDEVSKVQVQGFGSVKISEQTIIIASSINAPGNIKSAEMAKVASRVEKTSRVLGNLINLVDELAFEVNGVANIAGDKGAKVMQKSSEVRNITAKSTIAIDQTANMIMNSIKKLDEGKDSVNIAVDALDELASIFFGKNKK